MNNQKQKTINTYKEKDTVESFDKGRGKYAFQNYKNKIESHFLRNTIQKSHQNEIKILDVACGTGRMLPTIFSFQKKIKYFGLDTSNEMTNILKKRAKNLGVEDKINIKISDAAKIPFENHTFDFVYSFHLLWHLPKKEQEKVIKEMLRVCKKGGFIIFDVLNKDFVWEGIKNLRNKKMTEGIYKLSLKEIKRILERKKIRIEKLNDFPIKNDYLYEIANIFNKLRHILPKNLYHMLFFRVKV